MKSLAILGVTLLAATLCITGNATAHAHHHWHCDSDEFFRGDDVEVSLDDGSIMFTHDEPDEKVEITEEYELIVNGRAVPLNHSQHRLVEKYYDCFSDVTGEAALIAKDAAKIGARGAKLGVCAIFGVLKLLSPDYDSKDLEVDLNLKADKIERMAERIEKRGAKLEKRAESLKCMHGELRHEIDELDALGWF